MVVDWVYSNEGKFETYMSIGVIGRRSYTFKIDKHCKASRWVLSGSIGGSDMPASFFNSVDEAKRRAETLWLSYPRVFDQGRSSRVTPLTPGAVMRQPGHKPRVVSRRKKER